MTLLVITTLVFLTTIGLTVSAAYFLIQVPASRKQMRSRLRSIQEASIAGTPAPESEIVHQEILSTIPAINRILLQIPFISRLQLLLTQAAVTIPVETLLSISIATVLFAVLVSYVAGFPALLVCLIAVVAGGGPFFVIQMKRNRRFKKFEELFPDAIDLLARAVRAGHAFTTGFSLIATEMPEPIAGEFRTTFEQQNLGLPLTDALQNLSIRVPLPDVRIFHAALSIQRESGGNLGEVLDNLSTVIRERFKLLRQVQVFSAEGRMSLYILTAIPPLAGVLMYLANPEYMSRLFTDPIGRDAIGAAVVLQVVGYLVIRHIVRIKV